MVTLIVALGLALECMLAPLSPAQIKSGESQQPRPATRQLLAVRGEITRIAGSGKGLLSITVKPEAGFESVSVTAHENDTVGPATGSEPEIDLLDLLTGSDAADDQTITAAELQKGDYVSVIYDPQLQNRALEIYRH